MSDEKKSDFSLTSAGTRCRISAFQVTQGYGGIGNTSVSGTAIRGSSPCSPINNTAEKSGSFKTAALLFSAFYATNRDIVRHLRYAPIIRPIYAHFRALIYALFFSDGKRTFPSVVQRQSLGLKLGKGRHVQKLRTMAHKVTCRPCNFIAFF